MPAAVSPSTTRNFHSPSEKKQRGNDESKEEDALRLLPAVLEPPSTRTNQQASSAACRGLADGLFHKVDVTTSTGDTFDIASESALEVYNISNIESDAEGA
ncbi:hypothetical protein B0H14DRAFT_3441877 [Mycena olivaceomarginata]|nr:hypothetical protein B0H14DRAFT_3441877 [Mycena olivaceomarginata]